MKRLSHLRYAGYTMLLIFGLSACDRVERPSAAELELLRAKALFADRCTTSGVKILRVVRDVESILILKVRPRNVDPDFRKQYLMNDPYGHDVTGDAYLRSFMRSYHDSYPRKKNHPPNLVDPFRGYKDVQYIDPNNGRRYVVTGKLKKVRSRANPKKFVSRFMITKKISTRGRPRYGITYDDISTRLDRKYWIAGSSLKIVDLENDIIIAERVGYMMDYGQGDISGGRSPWVMAWRTACPSFSFSPYYNKSNLSVQQTRYFIEHVLLPRE